MVTVMYACPRCGQRAAIEADPGKSAEAPEVPCAVCGTAMEPVQRVCECGKELRTPGSR